MRRWGFDVLYTPGLGYERDFRIAIDMAPVVVAACDLANLSPSAILELAKRDKFATAISRGEPVGLSYLPNAELEKWEEVRLDELMDVDVSEDLKRAEEICPTAYPLYVSANCLLPHEGVLEEREYEVVKPIAVDYSTGVILDGHHRFAFLRKMGVVPALLFDYSALDVNLPKEEIVARAERGELYPPRTTRHLYKGLHISELPTVEIPIGSMVRKRPLECKRI